MKKTYWAVEDTETGELRRKYCNGDRYNPNSFSPPQLLSGNMPEQKVAELYCASFERPVKVEIRRVE